MRHSASEKRPEGLSLARGWRREAYGDRGSASCGECRKVVEVWCVKSGKWRTAGNIISCAWAQGITAGRSCCGPDWATACPPVWGAGGHEYAATGRRRAAAGPPPGRRRAAAGPPPGRRRAAAGPRASYQAPLRVVLAARFGPGRGAWRASAATDILDGHAARGRCQHSTAGCHRPCVGRFTSIH
jgi:hypothetical protein